MLNRIKRFSGWGWVWSFLVLQRAEAGVGGRHFRFSLIVLAVPSIPMAALVCAGAQTEPRREDGATPQAGEGAADETAGEPLCFCHWKSSQNNARKPPTLSILLQLTLVRSQPCSK